jgi:hypothetical protein
MKTRSPMEMMEEELVRDYGVKPEIAKKLAKKGMQEMKEMTDNELEISLALAKDKQIQEILEAAKEEENK